MSERLTLLPKEVSQAEKAQLAEKPDILDEQKALTRLKAAFAALRPNSVRHLEFLEKEGIIERIGLVIRENPFKEWVVAKYGNRYLSDARASEEIEQAYFIEMIGKMLPKNFILSENLKLRELNRCPDEVGPPEAWQALYHLVDDKNLLAIVKEGFRNLDDHGIKPQSTGKFERILGLNGIFFSCGQIYDSYDGDAYKDVGSDTNLVVFPFELTEASDAVCINGELSFSFLFDHLSEDEMHDIYTFLGYETCLLEKLLTNLDHDTWRTLFALFLVEMLDHVITPTHLHDKKQAVTNEICIPSKNLSFPQMIIVSEEPEYFYEEAQACNSYFVNVPIIEDSKIFEALKIFEFEKIVEAREEFSIAKKELVTAEKEFENAEKNSEIGNKVSKVLQKFENAEEKFGIAKKNFYENIAKIYRAREKFVELVNQGKINPMDWACNRK